MLTNEHAGGSATIYEFPSRARIAALGRREAARRAVEFSPKPVSTLVYSGAGYHEEAIQAAYPSWKR
jgi:hypothetical protein